MPRDVVVLHIPKTAGTSLRKAIEESNKDRTLYFDYGIASPVTHHLIREFRKNRPDLHFRDEVIGNSQSGIVLMGHFQVSEYIRYFPYECFVTFLRNPVQRVISEYKHFARSYNFKGTLATFAKSPDFRNKQARYLSGIPLEKFGFIGLLENGNSEFTKLADYMGVEYKVEKDNTAPAEQVVDIDASVVRMIEDLNSEDMELYKRVSQLRGSPPVFENPQLQQSHAVRTLEGDVRGWVLTSDNERIARIAVVRNGVKLGEVQADLHRPDLRKSGISEKGYGGFKVDQKDFGRLRGVRLFLGENEIVVR